MRGASLAQLKKSLFEFQFVLRIGSSPGDGSRKCLRRNEVQFANKTSCVI